jgi:hypothetical protein
LGPFPFYSPIPPSEEGGISFSPNKILVAGSSNKYGGVR